MMKLLFSSVCALCLWVLVSCGESGTTDFASATVSLTDAASDEVEKFEVNVDSIVLKRPAGTVRFLSRPTPVDFAQLERVTELLVGSRVPVGIYTGMTMTLDFANASVLLVGKTTPATIVDADGNPITGNVTVDVNFAASSQPSLRVSRNHLFVLDLDLNQSLTVDLANNRVTFSPVATAEVDPTNAKPVFTRGFLISVSTGSNSFTLERRSPTNAVLGRYSVSVNGTTVYQIDGNNSVGASGLATLNSRVDQTPLVFVQGTVSRTSRTINAVAVETGAGTPGNNQDYVTGHIIARDNAAGNNAILTVLGSSVDFPARTQKFNTVHTVSVNFASTKVLRKLRNANFTTDMLNVGQRIAAFGSFDGSGLALDAGSFQGICRILDTSVWGTATGAPAGTVITLNVARIGRHPVGRFNFTVAGNAQANPATYSVDATGIATTGIVTGTKIRAIGIVNPVDVAADQDFDADVIINQTTASVLLCQWAPANTTAVAPSATNLTLDVSAAAIKAVGDGFGNTDLTNGPPATTIESAAALGIFRIVQNGAVETHLNFADFSTSLTTRIAAAAVFRVSALGVFDSTTKVFKARVLSVVLK